ncbi:MAG: hypothetical protein ACM3UU_05885 [Ignavibacteriales bacterium]
MKNLFIYSVLLSSLFLFSCNNDKIESNPEDGCTECKKEKNLATVSLAGLLKEYDASLYDAWIASAGFAEYKESTFGILDLENTEVYKVIDRDEKGVITPIITNDPNVTKQLIGMYRDGFKVFIHEVIRGAHNVTINEYTSNGDLFLSWVVDYNGNIIDVPVKTAWGDWKKCVTETIDWCFDNQPCGVACIVWGVPCGMSLAINCAITAHPSGSW